MRQHYGCHPHWNKGVNIIKLEFDMSMFAFYIVVFAAWTRCSRMRSLFLGIVCRGSCVQCTQSLIEVQKSTSRNTICFGFVEEKVF